MRKGRIFWGVLFVEVGAIVLLENAGLLPDSWNFPWEWWPLILVLIGLGMMFRSGLTGSIVTVLAALLLGLLVTGFFHFGSCFWRNHEGRLTLLREDDVRHVLSDVEKCQTMSPAGILLNSPSVDGNENGKILRSLNHQRPDRYS